MVRRRAASGGRERSAENAHSDGAQVTALVPIKHYHPLYLELCIRSIATQSCGSWRCVVVVEPRDREHFAALLREALADPRTQLVVNEGRKLAGAINTGMRHAGTEFVALLLGDDMWAANAVDVLNAYIAAEPDVDFFHSSRMVVDEDGRAISSVHPSRATFTLEDFWRASPVKHLLCWRRSLGLSVGGIDETLNSVGPDDYDFPWVMAEHGARFRAVAECLYYYRDHRECFRLTTHLPLSVHQRECDRIMRKHRVARQTRKGFLARARRSFMRQCLYRNACDRWLQQRLGYDPRRGWRETYR